MNEKGSILGIIGAWTGAGAAFFVQNISTVLVAVATLFAILSSFYSWRINRRKDRYLRAMDEHACEQCKITSNPFNCPHPENERPPNCWLRKQEERNHPK